MKNNSRAGSWIFLRNFFICCLSLEDQMKWAVQKAKKDLERATKFQVALEDELHSNKQGLPFLRCHCLGYVMHPQFVLALFNFTRQLAVFWPKVCYACQQFVLALFNFTRQLAVFRPKVVFPRWGTYSNLESFIRDTIACTWTYCWFTWRHTSNIYGWILTRMLIFARNPTFVEKKNKVPARRVRE